MVKKGDIADIWCGIDLGVRYTVGACALFADGHRRNLAVKKSALGLPTKMYKEYLEDKKLQYKVKDGDRELEAGFLLDLEAETPRRKEDEPMAAYFARWLDRRKKLAAFYGQRCLLKRDWDRKNSQRAEFDRLTDALLQMVGGNSRSKVTRETSPIFAIGVGDFSNDGSLHTSFIKHFINKVSALGYRCVGVGEAYTSQKCPCCQEQTGQIGLRVKTCSNCAKLLNLPTYVKYFHRDVMAAENIAIAAREIGRTGKRPEYLMKDEKEEKKPPDKKASSSQVAKPPDGGGDGTGSLTIKIKIPGKKPTDGGGETSESKKPTLKLTLSPKEPTTGEALV